MSHIVTIKTEVRDAEAVRAACKRLGLDEPVQGTARLFSGEATGLLVKLPGWLYPAVADLGTGQVHYDNYEGRGATRSTWTPSSRRTPWRRPRSRPASGATPSSSSPSPTAPSS